METRALRADAARNRERLLAVALDAFTEHGRDASLESIAKNAGVGIGTLYRHFPTREALVVATYRHEVEQLAASVDGFLARFAPDEALLKWMERYVDYVATKRGMAAALKPLTDSDSQFFAPTRAAILDALRTLLSAGIEAGSIRPDVPADDVMRAMNGVCLAASDDAWQEHSKRLLALLVDGLRFGVPATA
jgi:AcrR family transcriptional regulator